ncbi:tyrosine-type recombinase/integrase [Salipiger abyssi]|uniref:Site-specific recombinase XerD n=1 Tax=Salipiger abyssi TaxID=1250539 RepID=A0A1P8V0R9_9RHOB|nr:tyrosine-type recombinase/integrase [Salipiger abyssi]APZ55215.1 site-specific recombinase XerD [Salipiger abyssi]
MTALTAPFTASLPRLSEQETAALNDLYRRGTPENTLRAYERDLVYIAAWKRTRLDAGLTWPEDETTALLFLLDHSRDLGPADIADPARGTAETLIAAGLRRSLACPAPASLDRRIASWRSFHRMKGLASPFDSPALRQARAKARRANARPRAPKSANPITREVLTALLDTCGPGLRGIRDRALLTLGWASGGRRRSELARLRREDVDLSEFDSQTRLWIQLVQTKTTDAGGTPKLILQGMTARALVAWIDAAEISDGPLFRPISRAGRALPRGLSAEALRHILRQRLVQAGLPADFASAHGLRSGFLTQAALDGVPVQAAMRLSLHRSLAQAARYYDDIDPAQNPAARLLEPPE